MQEFVSSQPRQPAGAGSVSRGPTLVQWGAVFSGAVTGVALFSLATTLWLALGYDSGVAWWRDTLAWWMGATAVVAAFVAGAMAGFLSGTRGGGGPGNSVTVWALVTLAAVLGGIPVGLGYFGTGGTTLVALPGESLWTGFWSLLIGLVAAAIGGAIGASMTRPGLHAGQAYDSRRGAGSDGYPAGQEDPASASADPAADPRQPRVRR